MSQSELIKTLKLRAELLATARSFFAQRSVLEVETPVLGASAVTDPNIQSFVVADENKPPRYLQSSPEFFMKRLLVDGAPDIYQITKAFRQAEAGARHNPEFTLIEWYRRQFDLAQISQETAELVQQLLLIREISLPIQRISYRAACQQMLGLDLIEQSLQSLIQLATKQGLVAAEKLPRAALYDFIFDQAVVARLPQDVIHIVEYYPAEQASLAQLSQTDAQLAERFEIFAGGFELANGFLELRDADEQRQRFQQDVQIRSEQGLPTVAIDETFIAALRQGLPACAGVALGLDRVHLIVAQVDSLDQLLPFSWSAL